MLNSSSEFDFTNDMQYVLEKNIFVSQMSSLTNSILVCMYVYNTCAYTKSEVTVMFYVMCFRIVTLEIYRIRR